MVLDDESSFSFLCVYISSNVVRRVGRLVRTDDTLHYVRVKKDIVTGRTYHPKRHDDLEKTETMTEAQYMRSEYGYVYLPSLSAVIILSISRWSLLLAVHTFLAGLGFMPYFWWKNNKANSEASKGGRLIFWSFVITICLFVIGWMHIRVQHAGEQEDHDVRDRLIVGLESKRQQHLVEQSCESHEEWIAWRKQVKRAIELNEPSISPDSPTKTPSMKHTQDLEAAAQFTKPSALKRALSRFPLFGSVNGERVNFGQWIPTWRGRDKMEARGWLNKLRTPSGPDAVAMEPVLAAASRPAGPTQTLVSSVETVEHSLPHKDAAAVHVPTPKPKDLAENRSLAAMCQEIAKVAEQCAASARQQAQLTAMLASHVSGEGQAISASKEDQDSEDEVTAVKDTRKKPTS